MLLQLARRRLPGWPPAQVHLPGRRGPSARPSTSPRRRRGGRALAGVTAAVAALLIAGAGAASAHATLESTDPAQGTVLTAPPSRVTATFDEAVGVSADSLRVFGPGGDRVDDGTTVPGATPQAITTSLHSGLADGTYTVAWHVVSADSHPVSGAFTFSIGAPSATHVNPAALSRSAGAGVGVAYGVARWAAYAGYAVLVGAVAFLIVCWPAGARRRDTVRLVIVGWATLAAGTVVALFLQGPYGGGLSAGSAFSAEVLRTTLGSPIGQALLARVWLLALAAVLLGVGLPRLADAGPRARVGLGAVWGALAAGVAATWASADHASVGMQVPLALASDIVHLLAAAVWLGGLALLVTIVLRPRRAATRPARGGTAVRRPRAPQRTAAPAGGPAPAEALAAVRAFSPIAFGCVVAIVGTGVYQTWRDVGSIAALTATDYGRLVLLKMAGVVVLVCLGAAARKRLAEEVPGDAATALLARARARLTGWTTSPSPAAAVAAGGLAGPATARGGLATAARAANAGRGRAGRSPEVGSLRHPGRRVGRVGGGDPVVGQELSQLRRSVAAEAGLGAVVLAVTALLVSTATGRETYTAPASVTESFDTGGPGGAGTAHISLTPARIGPNEVYVSVDRGGTPYSPPEVDVAFSLPARGIGPLAATVVKDGPGRYETRPQALGVAGQWQLSITIRSDDFDETTLTVPMTVA